MSDESGFKVCDNKGFHITFPNGIVLSTQFGGGNYCANRNDEINSLATNGKRCANAEVAAFHGVKGGPWVTREVFAAAGLQDPGDDVAGWIGVDDWLKLVNACATFTPKDKP